jgi:hypothetical protein
MEFLRPTASALWGTLTTMAVPPLLKVALRTQCPESVAGCHPAPSPQDLVGIAGNSDQSCGDAISRGHPIDELPAFCIGKGTHVGQIVFAGTISVARQIQLVVDRFALREPMLDEIQQVGFR